MTVLIRRQRRLYWTAYVNTELAASFLLLEIGSPGLQASCPEFYVKDIGLEIIHIRISMMAECRTKNTGMT
jgi:hypothetical protein